MSRTGRWLRLTLEGAGTGAERGFQSVQHRSSIQVESAFRLYRHRPRRKVTSAPASDPLALAVCAGDADLERYLCGWELAALRRQVASGNVVPTVDLGDVGIFPAGLSGRAGRSPRPATGASRGYGWTTGQRKSAAPALVTVTSPAS